MNNISFKNFYVKAYKDKFCIIGGGAALKKDGSFFPGSEELFHLFDTELRAKQYLEALQHGLKLKELNPSDRYADFDYEITIICCINGWFAKKKASEGGDYLNSKAQFESWNDNNYTKTLQELLDRIQTYKINGLKVWYSTTVTGRCYISGNGYTLVKDGTLSPATQSNHANMQYFNSYEEAEQYLTNLRVKQMTEAKEDQKPTYKVFESADCEGLYFVYAAKGIRLLTNGSVGAPNSSHGIRYFANMKKAEDAIANLLKRKHETKTEPDLNRCIVVKHDQLFYISDNKEYESFLNNDGEFSTSSVPNTSMPKSFTSELHARHYLEALQHGFKLEWAALTPFAYARFDEELIIGCNCNGWFAKNNADKPSYLNSDSQFTTNLTHFSKSLKDLLDLIQKYKESKTQKSSPASPEATQEKRIEKLARLPILMEDLHTIYIPMLRPSQFLKSTYLWPLQLFKWKNLSMNLNKLFGWWV